MPFTTLPEQDFHFKYIAIDGDSTSSACSFPVPLNFADYKDKKIVITGAPAAFSPTCSNDHIPGYVANLQKLLNKGVDEVIVLTVDNPFANVAWAKSLGVKETKHIKFVTDPACQFSKSIGFELDTGDGALWATRYAIISDKGKITYAEKEENPGSEVTSSSVEAVLAKL